MEEREQLGSHPDSTGPGDRGAGEKRWLGSAYDLWVKSARFCSRIGCGGMRGRGANRIQGKK